MNIFDEFGDMKITLSSFVGGKAVITLNNLKKELYEDFKEKYNKELILLLKALSQDNEIKEAFEVAIKRIKEIN